LKTPLIIFLSAIFSQTSQGIITAHFVEENNGLTLSFSGVLEVDPNLVNTVDMGSGQRAVPYF